MQEALEEVGLRHFGDTRPLLFTLNLFIWCWTLLHTSSSPLCTSCQWRLPFVLGRSGWTVCAVDQNIWLWSMKLFSHWFLAWNSLPPEIKTTSLTVLLPA